MRAIVYDRYGPPDVLHLADVPAPQPRDDEVLVRVHAVAVTRADCATRDANRKSGPLTTVISRLVSGIRRPRQPILGTEFSGGVVETGSAVMEFAPGDRVFGSTGFGFGAYAELLTIREGGRIARMPLNTGYEEAASLTDGGLNALWCLKQGDVGAGTTILIYGASGAIGTAAVQIARHLGAEVTAVCGTKNLELVSSLGAHEVIDYTRDDFTQNGRTYDVIFDAVGKESFRRCAASLNPGGRYLATDGLGNFVLALWHRRFGNRKVKFELPPRYTKQDVQRLKELVESGEFRPVIDRRYAFADVIEASRYVETEQKTGNVILIVTAA